VVKAEGIAEEQMGTRELAQHRVVGVPKVGMWGQRVGEAEKSEYQQN
jgi:hypothetical protein